MRKWSIRLFLAVVQNEKLSVPFGRLEQVKGRSLSRSQRDQQFRVSTR